MIDPREIMNLINPHVSRVLTIAQAALPRDQFSAFRKLVLDEFGRQGLEDELYEFIAQRHDKRNG